MNMDKNRILSYAMSYSLLVFWARMALVGLAMLVGAGISMGGAILFCYACHIFANTWATANLWAINSINEKNMNDGILETSPLH
ncbi:hypothetical protein LCGC14_0651660 [marine sediment metagenome]|uniref:Uncharacterized protein n=1 Tax=marine sediment metagenome TaxID=412755 RepID=A0A0F9R1E3_9ZZZZ